MRLGLRILTVTAALLFAAGVAAAESAAAPGVNSGIAWHGCGKRLQCARVRVPLDWNRPHGRHIDLAVIRHLASRPKQRIGSLFVNPGGPGDTGVGLVRNAGADLDAVGKGRFNVVSWDPRGTNASTHVRCFRSSNGEDRFWKGARIPMTNAASRRFRRKTADLARRCGEVSGRLLRHISTADTARDLDYLRRLVGERQLTYMGFSYGTFLGETYSNMFPGRVRAMVLDGVVDPVAWTRSAEARIANVNRPPDAVFARLESLCQSAGPKRCALAGHGEPVAERVKRLFARVRKAPIPAPSSSPPGRLDYGDLLLALYAPIRNPAMWPKVAKDLEAAARGDGSELETQARAARAPSAWAEATTSTAIQCADGPARRSSRAWPKVIRRFTRISYLQGPLHGWWEWAPCASWPVRAADRYTGPWSASTKHPILVIGTRHDPNTAYANARHVSRLLGNARLLTHDGYGHVSFQDPSGCVDRAKTAYLVHLTIPPRGTVCPSDRKPFDPNFGQPLP